jgi:hypothetical protein
MARLAKKHKKDIAVIFQRLLLSTVLNGKDPGGMTGVLDSDGLTGGNDGSGRA